MLDYHGVNTSRVIESCCDILLDFIILNYHLSLFDLSLTIFLESLCMLKIIEKIIYILAKLAPPL